MNTLNADTLQALTESACEFALSVLDGMSDEDRAAVAAAVRQHGCMIEIRVCPLSQDRVRLVLLDANRNEVDIARLCAREGVTH